jgi:hypothetical protein
MKTSRRGFLGMLGIGATIAATSTFTYAGEDGKEKTVPIKTVEKKRHMTSVADSSLKPDRDIGMSTCNVFCDKPAKRGQVMEYIDRYEELLGVNVVRPGQNGGTPFGVCLNDVVYIDFNSPVNLDDKVDVGGRILIAKRGWVVVGPFDKPVKINSAIYYDVNGNMTTKPQEGQGPIGVALSNNDSDGFVKVAINFS